MEMADNPKLVSSIIIPCKFQNLQVFYWFLSLSFFNVYFMVLLVCLVHPCCLFLQLNNLYFSFLIFGFLILD